MTFQIEVEIMKMTKQVGSNDCKLYAIAVATALAYEIDPTFLIFAQDEMRSQQKFTPLPTKRKCRIENPVLTNFIMYKCPICKKLYDGTGMVQYV